MTYPKLAEVANKVNKAKPISCPEIETGGQSVNAKTIFILSITYTM